MSVRYTDEEIAAFLSERKTLPQNYKTLIQPREKRGHREGELDLIGSNGNDFRLILRQSCSNSLDFSVILALMPKNTNQLFRLRRYNGKSHQHTNRIEEETFYNFHIHVATQRYQELGTREDTYAKPSDRYGTFHEAVQCLLKDSGFDIPANRQRTLFDEAEM